MSFPLRLDLMLKEGVLDIIRIKAGTEYKIGVKQRILLLSGYVNHVTGTDSKVTFYIHPNSAAEELTNSTILSAVANGQYPLFNTVADATQMQPSLVILKEKDCIVFAGGANALVHLHVIRWQRP